MPPPSGLAQTFILKAIASAVFITAIESTTDKMKTAFLKTAQCLLWW
jgi:hypothetical protein